MKVLLVHTYYQQPGGEDEVFRAEAALLEEHGHEVVRFTAHNDQIRELSALQVAGKTLWNGSIKSRFRDVLRRERPEIVHVHNTFPLMSPSIYHAAAAEGVPVVQTLHNYRLLCPMAEFFRDGKVCEDCLGRVPWPGVLHGCYRDSWTMSAGVAGMLALHRAIGTWRDKIAAYVALTEFGRDKFVGGGLPGERIHVKPNFITPDPGPGRGGGGYALFVGRLSRTKGLDTMLEAWDLLEDPPPLKIVGDGPLADLVRERSSAADRVEWLGRKPRQDVLALMREAVMLVFPSLWYEGQPIVIIEALASGLPVVASDHGAMASMIDDGVTGLLFRPGDSRALADKVLWATDDPARLTELRAGARAGYEARYTSERNYTILERIYQAARESLSLF